MIDYNFQRGTPQLKAVGREETGSWKFYSISICLMDQNFILAHLIRGITGTSHISTQGAAAGPLPHLVLDFIFVLDVISIQVISYFAKFFHVFSNIN